MRRPKWQQQGQEPDYRFSMANERTFLAWIRTALALLAAAIVLDQFSVMQPQQIYTSYLAFFSSAAAAAICPMAFLRWKANEIAMRNNQALPSSSFILFISVSFAIAAATVVMLLIKNS
ncbi:YidH family protein [Comamonas testosteroni]|uniref:YidH family protein n=1 Tax=Comamonas testosteroni TaxID=285 RepID=UPI0009B8DC0A|nr:DUF202 domain-containing protein [Comamonas testosteroni]